MGARLDQHYLVDEGVRDAVVAAAELGPQDQVLEIGPGRGILTRELISRARRVVAVELDELLAAYLGPSLHMPANLSVVQSDFLEFDLKQLGSGPWKVAANLPYAVATPILQRILAWPAWTQAVLMFQKEVAERLIAAPGGGDYGLLTLSVRIFAEAEPVVDAPPDAFRPRPKVDSAVVRLRRRPEPLIPADSQAGFFKVARAAFGQRRKMALGLLSRAFGLERNAVAEAFSACGVPASARAENITFEAFAALARRLGA
jgi:16S rRNA (adenine1518-N6/adenine1519-N6)-dimethyltransferase